MKKKLLLSAMTVLLLAGCAEQTQEVKVASNENVRFSGLKGSVTIVKDNETGCKYIKEEEGYGQTKAFGLTVLMKSDGTADCD